jgi:hypothetical protein
VQYSETDKLEVHVTFYLEGRKLTVLDLENRLKDLFDALQGFLGDKGTRGHLVPIIPNDSQIYRIVVEKRRPPKAAAKSLSTVVIKKYTNDRRTARAPREFAKKPPVRSDRPSRVSAQGRG